MYARRWIAVATVYFVLFLCLPLSAFAGKVDVVLANLRASAKLHAPNDILADFVNGEPETAVIVLVQPTTEANDLAVKSMMSAQVPAEFTKPGAPTYYNLQDESVRTQLRATVTQTVGHVIDRLGTTGMTLTQRFSYQFGFAARVTPGALERIVNSPDVVSVEKDAILHAHLAQGIPLMNATTVRSSYTGSGVSIAICDTGIDVSHPRLGGTSYFPNSKVIGGYDTGDNDTDPRPDSVNGQPHGTCCAGIAAGDTGTVGDYIGGVAPDAKLYAVKISTGTDGSATTSAMIAGWEWAVTHQNDNASNPILVISTSFGGSRFTSTCDSSSPSMTTAAANAVATGITIFASSGNDGYCDSIAWPACISYVNSVGAVYDANVGSNNWCVSSYSCATKVATGGCTSGYYSTDSSNPDKVTVYSNSASFLTLFAPSNNAYTTDIVGAGGYSTGDYYPTFGGTSAASPYAAGSAAVLQQAAKAKTGSYLTPAQVKSYLVNNGDNVTDGKVAITKPRINLGRAVDALPNIPATVVSTVPTNGANGVLVTDPITATFSKAMKATTINSTNFYLNKGATGPVSYVSATKTAILTPSASLATNTVYTATVTTNVTDEAGNHLATAKTWNFTTGDGTNPLFSVRLVGGRDYDSLQPAYVAAGASCTILAKAVELPTPNFTLDDGKTVTLKGGYNSTYTLKNGYTTLQGILTLGTGSLTVENLIISQ